jgi:hypothetical protein
MALRAVIDDSARLAGIEVDEGLVARLVSDTDSGEALPLLASRYKQLGGVRGRWPAKPRPP